MYCKFINKNYVYPCPASGYVNGRGISNLPRYFEKNPEIAKAEGYKTLDVDDTPKYDTDTQYLTFFYENTDEAIVKHWMVNNAPIADEPEEPTNLEERVTTLEEKVEEQSEVTKILMGGVE